jgi:putative FmdB family regulatory protein
MPKYDYRCSAGHLYEKREGFDAPPLQPCQQCGLEARRVLTSPAIVFKGSGWYITDSRGSKGAATPAAEGADAESKNGESAPAAGEAKPAPAAEGAAKPAAESSAKPAGESAQKPAAE